MISREFALIVTVLTLGFGGTMTLANSAQEPSSSVLLSQTKVLAQERENRPNRPNRPRGRNRGDQLQQALNLSDEQMQKLNEIQQNYRPQIQELAKQIQATYQEFNQMMQGNASEDEVRSKHKELAGLRQKMEDIRFESMLEMRTILTEEQRQKFAQFMQQRRQRRDGNRPNRGGRP